MRIAIIGGGITGLTAAYELTRAGHKVTVFEKESSLGGLAYGFKQPNWSWHIEGAYHHLFTNDAAIIGLLKKLGLKHDLIVKRPITAHLLPTSTSLQDTPTSKPGFDSLEGAPIFPLDSPLRLFQFPILSIVDKFRTALLLTFLKITPFWKPLESITAEQLITSIGGKHAFTTIWEPLLYGKFGTYAPLVAASWFWARIKKRTPHLCYIRGGFHTLVKALSGAVSENGGTILTSTTVESIKSASKGLYYVLWKNHKQKFDRVLITIPTPLALSLFPKHGIRNAQYDALRAIPHLSAQTLIIETDKPILKNVYWLNVTDQSFPFLAAVAHTNFMDPKHYSNHHLTYFGNYLPEGHPHLTMTKKQLLNIFLPFIRRTSPHATYNIHHTFLYTAPYAQPVHERHYSRKIPPIITPIPGIYFANMDYIVPWDRGTNYAVALGQNAAMTILRST